MIRSWLEEEEGLLTLATLIPLTKSIVPFGLTWCNLDNTLPISEVSVTKTRLLKIER